jgi:hypothetical protein
MKPQLIQIGSRILNLANVQYMDVVSPGQVDVHLTADWTIQYIEEESRALLGILATGYTVEVEISSTDQKWDGKL